MNSTFYFGCMVANAVAIIVNVLLILTPMRGYHMYYWIFLCASVVGYYACNNTYEILRRQEES